eukprot:CAMPEP_0184695116 /NCGR_PEP_ID=MMETSP0313-20130426/2852_1 /TAXON_ID=2792 /ORGANISM="Porphyridium aerugineum, Strain SAG 1380-2" /LENGTH=380 /DNA_ID=CAMNT_0027153511 /DNA_START=379 /DNA_END=1521 /DNA_ORIENTATION=-
MNQLAFIGAVGTPLSTGSKQSSFCRSPAALAAPSKKAFLPVQAKRSSRSPSWKCMLDRPERYTSLDWLRNLASLPRSAILYRVRSHIFANVAFSALIVLLYDKYPDLPFWQLSPIPHQLLGTLSSLLLVFRTNSSYDRFWEGRKLWGALVNRTRSMGIAAVSYFGHENKQSDPDAAATLLRLIGAFPTVLKNHLLTVPEGKLSPAVRSKPINVAQMISLRAARAFERRTGPNVMAERQTFEMGVADLIDILGACERIAKTPVPLSYSRHTSRFLSLWCLTLPFLYVRQDGWFVLLVQAAVSWAFFSIEEIGHLIEDPFSCSQFGLDLDGMANRIKTDLNHMLEDYSFESYTDDIAPEEKARREELVSGGPTKFKLPGFFN